MTAPRPRAERLLGLHRAASKAKNAARLAAEPLATRAQTWAPGIKAADVVMLAALAEVAAEAPRIDTLVKRTGYERATVSASLLRLEHKFGLVERESVDGWSRAAIVLTDTGKGGVDALFPANL